jgi:CRP-like cAMP-binding protein
VAGTVCGELPFLSETNRSARVSAERDCVAWKLDREGWRKIQELEGGDAICAEILRLGLKLTTERMDTITSYTPPTFYLVLMSKIYDDFRLKVRHFWILGVEGNILLSGALKAGCI